MSYSFDQQTAVITGAGSGIGFAIARQLALKGASVVLNDIEVGLAESAAAPIRGEGGRCVAFSGDAGDVDFIYRMVDRAVDEFGRLDLAIANAGLTLFGDFFSYGLDDFQKVVTLNLQGAFFLAQAAAKQMRARGQGGKILLMSSVLSLQPYPELAPYCMTKAALNMLARTLVLELAPYRITINALAPGATITERTLQDDPDYAQKWQQITPSGRAAHPDDIAQAALFLLSSDADHITGHMLMVDGRWSSTARYPELPSQPDPSTP